MKTRRTRSTKSKGPVRSKKVTYDGITFASGLEKYMYKALKEAKVKSKYEGELVVNDLLNNDISRNYNVCMDFTTFHIGIY